MLTKKCRRCGRRGCKKNGTRNGLQRYKCNECGYVWENKRQKKDHTKLYVEYSEGKQTYVQLAKKYKKHITTIKKYIESVTITKKN